ncbi:hypothetical protein JTB14_012639 [Gonioctena quinquepunctata]|nr:hypothetical protein JTB14_012639 [Gonioctena quinquepunctata]
MFKITLVLSLFCVSVFATRPYYRSIIDLGCDGRTEITDSCPNVSCRTEPTCDDREIHKRECPKYYTRCGDSLCYCKDGYARHEGACIKFEKCP